MYIVNNIDDFIAYFRGCYIARQEGEVLTPYLVEMVEGNAVFLRAARDMNVLGRVESFTFDEIVNTFKLTLPRAGAVSTKASLIYLSLNPIRQYRKGISPQRLTVKTFHSRNILPEDHLISAWIPHLYNNTYFEIDVLLDLFSKGERVGGALSPKLGLVVRQGIKDPLVIYKTSIVGAIKGDTIKLLPTYNLYTAYIERTTRKEIKEWS